MLRWISCMLLCALSISGWSVDDCGFDADDADSPGFVDKIVRCDTRQEHSNLVNAGDGRVIELYRDWQQDTDKGLSERVVVTAGFANHRSGQRYVAREAYSLQSGAKFEDSVTLAIHKLHLQMSRYCASGWSLQRQWSAAIKEQQGLYYLHYRFRCAEIQ